MMTLRRLHGLSALLVAGFACMHIANQLVGLRGPEAYMAFMQTARLVYRSPMVEAVLLVAVALQICSGLVLVMKGWT